MSSYTHQTAPTYFTEAGGIRFAYRRFGKKGSVPLLFFMHFAGTHRAHECHKLNRNRFNRMVLQVT